MASTFDDPEYFVKNSSSIFAIKFMILKCPLQAYMNNWGLKQCNELLTSRILNQFS